jgi:hypothetical protein
MSEELGVIEAIVRVSPEMAFATGGVLLVYTKTPNALLATRGIPNAIVLNNLDCFAERFVIDLLPVVME